MESFLIIVHVLAALAITGLVLIQQGKGADVGAAFGGGASQTIFGSVGTGNVLTKSTTWLTVVFFATSLSLALIAREQANSGIDEGQLIRNANQLQNVAPPPAPADSDVPVTGNAAPAPAAPADEQLDQAVQGVIDAAAAQEGAASEAEGAAPQADEEVENALEEAPQ
ncbi:MAG TPA: preprotein translocase subunit SecG [Hyphomicrobiales bacterium]|nr:preprotein translocase subunit SecG [Hyphomicrobiales bacterium]